MSEMGPMRSRSRRRWRISSCANAKGMAGSSAHPRATDAPSGTKRVTASARLRRLSVLAALVLGLPFFDEGLHAFTRVLALEEPDERLALDRKPFRERASVALHRRELDLAHRVAGAFGVRARPLHRARLQLLRRHDLVDDARVLRVLRRERRATQHHLESPLPTDEARQPLRAAGAGQQPESDFRQPDLVATLGGDTEVAAERDLKTA